MSRTQQKTAPPPPPRPKAAQTMEPHPESGIPVGELSFTLSTEPEAEELPLAALVLRDLDALTTDEERALCFVDLMMKVHERYPTLIKTEEVPDPEPEDVKHLSHEIAVVSLTTAYAFGGNNAEEEFNRVLIHFLSGLDEVSQDHMRVRMKAFAARFVDAAQAVSRKL